jgi:hypothetical protein
MFERVNKKAVVATMRCDSNLGHSWRQDSLNRMAHNDVHAVVAGKRTSPVHGPNLNRTFPGDPHEAVMWQIEAYTTAHPSDCRCLYDLR